MRGGLPPRGGGVPALSPAAAASAAVVTAPWQSLHAQHTQSLQAGRAAHSMRERFCCLRQKQGGQQ